MSNQNDLVVVFAGDKLEADLAKNALEINGIPAFLKDEFLGSTVPWVAAPGGIGAVKVTVPQKDTEEAIKIIKQINNSNSEE